MNYQNELTKFKKKKVDLSKKELSKIDNDSLYTIYQKISEIKKSTNKNEKIGKKSVIKLDKINKHHEKLIRKMDKVSATNMNIKKNQDEKEKIIDKLIFVYNQLYTIKDFVDNYSDSEKWQNTLNKTLIKAEKEIEKIGLTKISSLGEKFDPEIHIQVDEKEKEDIKSGIIIEVIQNGFLYKGKVFKEAEVIVSK